MQRHRTEYQTNLTEMEQSMRLLRITDVMSMTGFRSRDSIYRLVNAGLFPKPRKLVKGGRASGWVAAEIVGYLKERIS